MFQIDPLETEMLDSDNCEKLVKQKYLLDCFPRDRHFRGCRRHCRPPQKKKNPGGNASFQRESAKHPLDRNQFLKVRCMVNGYKKKTTVLLY